MGRAVSGVASATAGALAPPTEMLPRLRDDLAISAGPLDAAGHPTWQIYDALRHRFITIDQATCTILSLWRDHLNAAELAVAAARRSGQAYTLSDIEELSRFLTRNDLTQAGSDEWRKHGGATRQSHSKVMKLVHNYLFFKIPLFAPEPILRATSGIADLGGSRRVQLVIVGLGLVGLWLVSRQWDEFLLGARGLATIGGVAHLAVTLFCVKILHELGHAYTAMRYGCRVPIVGIAFMMMAPVLYTDVTDAWRLTDRRHRFAIDSAGVAVELALACIATFLWVFLPDGLMRQTVFMIATTSWIMSIGINLNPFMRFDGYYIFADLLGVDNLQARSFELGTWKMREVLFQLHEPPPEHFPKRRERLLIVYAWSVWLYRVVLFTGIALAVYAYFFKALGLALFFFEIGYFVLRPVLSETTQWWKMRSRIVRTDRTRMTVALAAALVLWFVVPWSSTVKIPAVLEAAELSQIYPPRAARVVAFHSLPGQLVRKGDLLIELMSADLESERILTLAKLTAVSTRLARIGADREDRDDSLVMESTRGALVNKLKGLNAEIAELSVRAPADGIVAEVNPNLRPGQWIAARERIALVRGTDRVSIVGYVAESDLWRIDVGAAGYFVPDMPQAASSSALLRSIAVNSTAHIEPPELVSTHGGRIEAFPDARQRFVPVSAHYLVTLDVITNNPVPPVRLRGVVNVEGRSESFFSAVWRRTLKVLVRESAA